jgi:N-acyl amino acid synthase of PEP-CTERM/exosortase system
MELQALGQIPSNRLANCNVIVPTMSAAALEWRQMNATHNSSMVYQNSLADQAPDRRGLGEGLLAQHDRYFSTVLADSPILQMTAHALRFQVYCLERKFENEEEHPDGLEKDVYDAHSIQGVLFHRPTRGVIGSVRMILPELNAADSFPVTTLLRENALELSDYVNPAQCIEVSRFAISKEFRRRKSDEIAASEISRADAGRETNLAFLSMLQFVLRESIKRDIMFWTAVMELLHARWAAGDTSWVASAMLLLPARNA